MSSSLAPSRIISACASGARSISGDQQNPFQNSGSTLHPDVEKIFRTSYKRNQKNFKIYLREIFNVHILEWWFQDVEGNYLLSKLNLDEAYLTGEHNLLYEFLLPCLSESKCYDRAAGFFNSSLYIAIEPGLESFISRGGKIRLVTSVKIDDHDVELIKRGYDEKKWLDEYLESTYRELYDHREDVNVSNLCWLIKNDYLDVRLTFPDLNEAEIEADSFYHDKLGVFSDDRENFVVFLGSNNESRGGWLKNYESFEVFCSWDTRVKERATRRKDYFKRLWDGECKFLKTHKFPDAYKERLKALASTEFNQQQTKRRGKQSNDPSQHQVTKWRHQEEAIGSFLTRKHGVLEMATGSGKTRTALRIANTLKTRHSIDSVIIAASGTDLLNQWVNEIYTFAPEWNVFRQYESYKELAGYLVNPIGGILIISREFLREAIVHITKNQARLNKSLLICDEVHGMGSPSNIRDLSGYLSLFEYRLGLSATPEREYDQAGNDFIANEIGEVIFQFELEDAIQRGILCEFDYHPIRYSLTDDDKVKRHQIIKAYHARKQANLPVNEKDFYNDLARVKKISLGKLAPFLNFVKNHPEILSKSIIFVETINFGREVQRILMQYQPYFHTYYGRDDRFNLERFSKGDISCLITCERLSEGIDIRSVENIILFSSDRSKLVTIQRIGRSLRIDPNNPLKRASVLDFICNGAEDGEVDTADHQRMTWLQSIANTRKE